MTSLFVADQTLTIIIVGNDFFRHNLNLNLRFVIFPAGAGTRPGSRCETSPADQRAAAAAASSRALRLLLGDETAPEPKLARLVSGQLSLHRSDVSWLTSLHYSVR